MNKIRVLSEHTINKIAAGEVIENPASVVKELVENSLDSGATDIAVEIRGGGRQLIRITDNGCGMSSDDALLCFERHATSKLKEVEDLQTIATMGFRGEAIPSIAAISKLTLLTCVQGHETGTLVKVEGGLIKNVAPAPCSEGTTFEIKDLFFNVPVRKNFQRSPAYDAQEIHKMLIQIALGNPQIRISLISNQETLLSAKSSSLKERIDEVLGKEFTRGVKEVKVEGEIVLEGYLGEPAWSRQNRSGQHLFINKRGVFSPLVAYALREGYGPSLQPQRHPIYVLHLTLPGSLVDVNVHPQKKEVRLRKEQALKELLIKSVEKILQGSPAQSSLKGEFEPPPFHAISYPTFRFPTYEVEFKETPTPQALTPTLFEPPPLAKTPPKVIATLPGYILIEGIEGIFLVDQRRAHARVIFQQLVTKEKNAIPQQALLIPFSLETSPAEGEILKGYTPLFEQLGISLREFGPHTFTIDALPTHFGNIDVEQLIHDLLNKIRDYHDPEAFRREQEIVIAQAASHAAVSKNKKLNYAEAQSLIQRWDQCESFYCPLGKKIAVHLKQEEISKWF